MPGWDVKIRPAKDEEKKKDDYSWVIVIVVVLFLWLILGSGVQGLRTSSGGYGCGGVHHAGYVCDRLSAPHRRHSAPSSGHDREDRDAADGRRP
jgi:hypothetical protein